MKTTSFGKFGLINKGENRNVSPFFISASYRWISEGIFGMTMEKVRCSLKN